jgi:flagellar capping protein FliD
MLLSLCLVHLRRVRVSHIAQLPSQAINNSTGYLDKDSNTFGSSHSSGSSGSSHPPKSGHFHDPVYDRIGKLEIDAAISKAEATHLESKADTGYANLSSQIGALSTRMDREFDKVDKKFEKIDNKFENIDRKFDAKFDTFDAKFNTFDAKFDKFDRFQRRMFSTVSNLLRICYICLTV